MAQSPGTTRTDEAAAPRPDDQAVASFEAAAERLAAIVRQLEGGELSLEQSLRLFEEGIALVRTAQRQLEHAEKRVEELLAIDEDGEARTRPFE
jgi:exodeoxyribonuclease VII small subunit